MENKMLRPRSAMILVTHACNLKCRYCFVHQHPSFMTLDMAKKSIDYLAGGLNSEEDIISINWFGGEPLLLFNQVIKPAMLYGEEKYSQIDWGITTNGVLLNDEIFDFFEQHNVSILMSMDGDRITQDFNRPCHNSNFSSFDLIAPKIPRLLKNDPDSVFRMTIIPETAQYFLQNLDFAAKQGFNHVFAIPNSFQEWTEYDFNVLKEQLYQYANYYIYTIKETDKAPLRLDPLEDEQKLYYNFLNNHTIPCHPASCADCHRCGVGAYGYGISIDPDGDIYGCQEMASLGPNNNPFYLGNITKQGIEEDRREALLNRALTDPYGGKTLDCSTCSRKEYCSSDGCGASNYLATSSLNMQSSIYCKWLQLLHEIGAYIQQQLFLDNRL